MPVPVDPLFSEVARWLLVGVFAVAVWHKLRAPATFVLIVDDYRLLPRKAAPITAGSIIGLELLVVVGLCFAATVRSAAILAMSLLGLYALAIGINLVRGRRDIDCGCTGPAASDQGRQRLTAWLPVRNLLLIALGTVITLPASPRELLWLDALGIAAGAGVALLVYLTMDRLTANRPLLDRLLQ